MKAVILAGGVGSRLSEETDVRPKPMVTIGNKPILWHIMKIYSAAGINDFIICLGYKGYVIKEYFANYFLHMSDVTFDLADNSMKVENKNVEPWRVTLVETGDATQTGGRLKRVRDYLDNETFMFTYGDGLIDLDIRKLLTWHRESNVEATITATRPPGRFGAMVLDGAYVTSFKEKPQLSQGWINGGFFVLEPQAVDRIPGDATEWEKDPLESLARDRQLAAYPHEGFWHPMDTLRDRRYLESLWSDAPPWRIW